MRVLRPVPDDFWWDVARACHHASFFHTPAWRSLVIEAFPGVADRSTGVELPGGARAVLPVFEVARLLRDRFVALESSYAGCYGGLISDRPLAAAESRAAWRAALAFPRIASVRVTGDPLAADAGPALAPAAPDATSLLDLAPGWDRVRSGFSEGHRRAIRRAAENGLTVAPAAGPDDVRAYYDVYRDSLRRWAGRATNDYPWSLFESGMRAGERHREAMTLWLCRHEGRVVAGAWVFRWNGRAIYWHGASLTSALELNPGHLLHAEIIRDACARGTAWYDFNPSGGHAGVLRFKEGFGAVARAVPRWAAEGRLYRVAGLVSRALRRVRP
jgi:hypothetical protein